MGFIDPYYIVFLGYKVFTIREVPQLWRILTTFVLTGPKFGLIMDPYFLYTYGSQLEMHAARFTGPGDFFVYLIFVAFVILVSFGGPRSSPLFLFCFHRKPRISARLAYNSYHGSWNRGRLPLRCAASIIRKSLKGCSWSVDMVGCHIERTVCPDFVA